MNFIIKNDRVIFLPLQYETIFKLNSSSAVTAEQFFSHFYFFWWFMNESILLLAKQTTLKCFSFSCWKIKQKKKFVKTDEHFSRSAQVRSVKILQKKVSDSGVARPISTWSEECCDTTEADFSDENAARRDESWKCFSLATFSALLNFPERVAKMFWESENALNRKENLCSSFHLLFSGKKQKLKISSCRPRHRKRKKLQISFEVEEKKDDSCSAIFYSLWCFSI